MSLQNFSADEIFITEQDAQQILAFYFPDKPLDAGALKATDIAFAQALLVEGVDRSYEMGFVEILFKSFYGKTPRSFESIRGMVRKFCQKALKHWFKHATGKDLENPEIYESVRLTIARNFGSVWAIRVQTGELTY